MNSDEITDKAQEILNTYCSKICKSECCHKGKVLLDNSFPKELIPKKNLIEREDSHCSLVLEDGCPFLDENLLCKIHKEQYKPKTCDEYPFFIKQNIILIAQGCHAVENGILDKMIEDFENIGLKVILV
ncbi:YkgJ family cysteine cluster protein [Candidatus Woesearchaeota archaeon]|nr:YkgJ family cysteine cluster protein [Candidatus Woesearchaeota archaeon]